MTMFQADLSVGRGKLWMKTPKPEADGTLVTAHRLGSGSDAIPSRRSDMFSHVAYGHAGDRFAAVDGRGDVYVFHLRANRFSLSFRAHSEVTAMTFCCGKDNDLLIATTDHSFRIVKSDTGVTVANLKSHRACVTCLASHPIERYAVSCGADNTLLWDLGSLRRMRNVGSGGRSAHTQAAFIHSGNTLVTMSKLEGVCLYHFPTLNIRAKLMLEPGDASTLRCFGLTANRMFLVAATSGRSAYVWHLPSETMIDEITLPVPCSSVGGLQPLLPYSSTKSPESSEICMLGTDGSVRVVQVPSGQVTATIGATCYNYAVHLDRVVCTTNDGSVNLMDISHQRWIHAQKPKSEKVMPARQSVSPLCSADSESNKKVHDGMRLVPKMVRPLAPNLDTIQENLSSMASTDSLEVVVRKKAEKPAKKKDSVRSQSSESASVDVQWQQRTERLRAFLDVHSAFSDEHRANVWLHLLCLPRNQVVYDALMAMGEHPLAADQLASIQLQDSRVKQRLCRVVYALSHWCEALACSSFLPTFVMPWVKFYGRDEHAAVEGCIMFIINWADTWFEYWPAPPIHFLGLAERLLFILDPLLTKHLGQISVSSKDWGWLLVNSMFSKVLDHKTWLQLMDHVLVQTPRFIVYLLVGFLVHMRGALLSLPDSTQLSSFLTCVHPVDVRTLIANVKKIEQVAKHHDVASQFGIAPDNQHIIKFLGLGSETGCYPSLTSFPRTSIDHHLSQYKQLKEEEEHYLMRRRVAEELEEQARRMVQRECAQKEQEQLVEQARQEQRRQMEVLSMERREKMKILDQQAKQARLDQILQMEAQCEEQAKFVSDKQQHALQELDRQLAMRWEDEEEWLRARLETEKLQDIELATAAKLHRAMQERQQESRALGLQVEIDARTKMLDTKQRMKEQRWMIEDQQKQLSSYMAVADAERDASNVEELQTRMAVEARMKLEESRLDQRLATVEAQRQARSLAEDLLTRQLHRQKENAEVEKALAAEELRHMDAVSRRREAEMRGRMQEGEKFIREEKLRVEQLKEKRRQRLRVLEARQRMERFENKLAEQQCAWKVAAVEHERQVHQVLTDLESERKQINAFDEEIATREDELRKKMESLDSQKAEHESFIAHERLKMRAGRTEDVLSGKARPATSSSAQSNIRLTADDKGYWQKRAQLAGINVTSAGGTGGADGTQAVFLSRSPLAASAAGAIHNSFGNDSSIGSEVLEDEVWVSHDVAAAKSIVASRQAAQTRHTLSSQEFSSHQKTSTVAGRVSQESYGYDFTVSVNEDSASTSDSSSMAPTASQQMRWQVGASQQMRWQVGVSDSGLTDTATSSSVQSKGWA